MNIIGIVNLIGMKGKGNESIAGTTMSPHPLTSPMTLTLDIQDQIINSCISGMRGPIDMME